MNTPMTPADEKFRTMAMYTAAGCFCFFMLAMTSCTVHMNMYNAGEAKTDQAAIEGEATLKLEHNRQKHTAEMERIAAIQKLVEETNANPIAAKCAIDGWDDMNSVDVAVCEEAARVAPIIVNSTRAE